MDRGVGLKPTWLTETNRLDVRFPPAPQSREGLALDGVAKPRVATETWMSRKL